VKKLLAFIAACAISGGLAWATVESVTYISDLNVSNPAAGDAKSEGDDHLRNIKTAIKNTFPNITGAVTATHTQLSYVTGVTSAIQTQIDAKAPIASPTFTGTPAAPTAASGTNTTQVATTAFVRGESGLVLLATSSASASATIDFTSGINSTYDEYEIHFQNVIPATNNATLNLRVSYDGATWQSTAEYTYAFNTVTTAASSTASGATNGTSMILTPALSNAAADGGASGVIHIITPSNTASFKHMLWDITSRASATGFTSGGGMYTKTDSSTSATVGIRFLASSGNLTSGGFKLYGVKKS
jgi:hypothetical protein